MAQGSSDENIDVHEEEGQYAKWKDDFLRDKDKFQVISEDKYILYRTATISHKKILRLEETMQAQRKKKQRLDIAKLLPKLTMNPSLASEIPPDLNCLLKVVLVGKAGNGKSATGNTFLGNQAFQVSQDISEGTGVTSLGVSKREDMTLHVIDTPGLFEAGMTDSTQEREVARSVGMSYEGVHAFLLVVNMNVRFTEEELKTVNEFKEHFGEEFTKYSILVFTHADAIIYGDKTLHQVCEGMKNKNEKLKAFIEEFGNRIIAIENECQNEGLVKKFRDLLILMVLYTSMDGKRLYASKLHSIAQKTRKKVTLNVTAEHIYKLMENRLQENSLFIYNIDKRKVPEDFIERVEGELRSIGFPSSKEDIEASTLRIMDREKRVFDAVFNDFASWPTRIKSACVIL